MSRNELREETIGNRELSIWAEWTDRMMERSCIGYNCRTDYAVASQSSGFGSKAPEVIMPPDIALIEQAVDEMSEDLQLAVYCRYRPEAAEERYHVDINYVGRRLKGHGLHLFMRISGRSQQDYYGLIKQACVFVAGRL